MPQRVTINEIAQRAGVSNATVSMALRDHPRISVDRRELIKKLAADMGYRRDPTLAMLASHRWKPSKSATGVAIAYIGWSRHSLYEIDRFIGAQRRMNELGYTVEPFKLAAEDSPLALAKILHERGIRGVIWDLPHSGKAFENMPWQKLTVVGMGRSSETLRMHSVQEEIFLACEHACEQVAAQGYRRPGLILYQDSYDQRLDLCEGAFWVACRKFGWTESGNLLFLDSSFTPDFMKTWLTSARPDAVISMVSFPLETIRQLEYRVPQELGFVSLHIWPYDPTHSGFDPMLRHQGELAGSLLHSLMLEGAWGLPDDVRIIGLEGKWQSGETLGIRG